MPASVVADALGSHYVTTTKLAAEAAVTWSRDVTAPRFRSPSGWTPSTTRDSRIRDLTSPDPRYPRSKFARNVARAERERKPMARQFRPS
ncbi:hypothetical protein [Nocardia sp. NPDC057440]|uniref:hypothetical protein n=1 Tax=Nocardia sp. NPDC057440 TaxID=3346134 RepID=UPI00366BAAF5